MSINNIEIMETDRNTGEAGQSWNKGPWKETILTIRTFQQFSAVSSDNLTTAQSES
jgi:hypothetical protein